MSIKELRQDHNETLPAYAWPGGYPLVYVTDDGGCLCPPCANGENGSEAHENSKCHGWRLAGWFVHYEGPAEVCDHCNTSIESAYGDDN